MNWPITSAIVNGQGVTVQVIAVNGRRVPPVLDQVIGEVRRYLAGQVRRMDPQRVQVAEDRRESIGQRQFEEVLAAHSPSGPSVVTVVFGPRVRGRMRGSFYMADRRQGSHVVWIGSARPGLTLRRLLQIMGRLFFLLLFPPAGRTKYILRHELYHALGTPCRTAHATEDHHCTHPECILSGRRSIMAWLGLCVRRRWPKDLCPACRSEIEQAHREAGGRLIPPDQPYDALADLDRLVALNPDQPVPFMYRAEEHARRGSWSRAVEDYEQALALGAGDKEILCRRNRGAMYWRLGQYDRAREDWEHCLRLSGKDALALRNLASLLATCPLADVREGRRAMELARRACELTHWEDADHLAVLASAHAECAEFDKAVEYQGKAISAAPGSKEDLHANLRLYQAGRPLRIPPR